MNLSLETIVFAKVRARLIPFMFLLYVVNYLDRVNIGFAALQMNRDLGFSPVEFGYGAGIFFWGYLLFEVPSNLLMERVGARLWIARIMLGWGVVSACMMFVKSAWMFYIMRFTLGVAEAGFFPGMILYLTYWFPASERAKATAQFMTATAIAGVVGGPLSGSLLTLDGYLGLAGWQWLFLVEGIPSVLLGFVVLAYLTDRPEQAHWLSDVEREWLVARMQEDRAARAAGVGGDHTQHAFLPALASPQVWMFALIYFTIVVGFYGIGFWLPQILKNLSGLRDFQIGLLAAIPYVIAAVAMVLVAASSDRTGERRKHVALTALMGAVALVLSAKMTHPALALMTFSLAAAGIWGTLGPFWALPTAALSGTAAAGGIALINSVGNLGGFWGPSMIGWVRAQTGSFTAALLFLAVAPLLTSILVMFVRPSSASSTSPTSSTGGGVLLEGGGK
jgi:ACS family tartrate transporter-like MFS transporter